MENNIFLIVQVVMQQVASHFTSTDIKDYYKIAFSYKQNDFNLYVNGAKIAADTSGQCIFFRLIL